MSKRYHRGAKYKRWQMAVFIKDDYKCCLCGGCEDLTADHIKPRVSHPDLFFDVSNGRTLCNECRVKDMLFSLERRLFKPIVETNYVSWVDA